MRQQQSRRNFFNTATGAVAAAAMFTGPLTAAAHAPRRLRVHFLFDTESPPNAKRVRYFHDVIWREAQEDLAKCEVTMQVVSSGRGCIYRPPDRPPVFEGLRPDAINIVLTRGIPMHWDRGRAWKGLSFRAGRFDICLIALDHAHPFLAPYLYNNTCVHELLHFLRGHVYRSRPQGLAGELLEWEVDVEATHLHFRGSPPAVA